MADDNTIPAGGFAPLPTETPAAAPAQQQQAAAPDTGNNLPSSMTRQSDDSDWSSALQKSVMDSPTQKAAEAAAEAKRKRDAGDDADDTPAQPVAAPKADDTQPKPDDKPPTAEELEQSVARSNLPKSNKEHVKQIRLAKEKAETDLKEALAKVAEFEEFKKKAGPIPDDLKAEVVRANEEKKALIAKLREHDIRSDPEYRSKYVAPVEANNKGIAEILTSIGKRAGMEDAKLTAALKQYEKDGYSIDVLSGEIQQLEKDGNYGDASRLRILAERNLTIQQDSEREFQSWQQSHTARTAEREAASARENEEAGRIALEAVNSTFTNETKELADILPFFKEPPKPLPTDTPAVSQAKQKVYDEYTSAVTSAQKFIDDLSGQVGLPDAKQRAAAQGKIYALARLGMTAKNILKSQYPQSNAATQKELTDLRAELAALKKTGNISRAHSADMGNGTGGGTGPKIAKGATTEDAFAATLQHAMQQQGVDVRR